MGQYRITITAVGGHGCQREVKHNETVQEYCGNPSCPDCKARKFVKELKESSNSVEEATLQHWPGTTGEVVDDLITHKRKGSF